MTEFNETKCKFCGTNKSPIYIMPRPTSKDDYWCEKCKKEKMEGS